MAKAGWPLLRPPLSSGGWLAWCLAAGQWGLQGVLGLVGGGGRGLVWFRAGPMGGLGSKAGVRFER